MSNELALNPQGGVASSDSKVADPSAAMIDPDLAKILARLATLQGKAIPLFRFELTKETMQGVPVENLSRIDQALELWADHFPEGERTRVSAETLDKSSFPVIWFSDSQDEVLLVRGQMVSGGFNVENARGAARLLDFSKACEGTFLQLTTVPQEDEINAQLHAPKTASQWFLHVVRKHTRMFGEACIASVAGSVIAMATAMYTMQVYDRVVPNNGFDTLWVLTFAVFVGICFEFLMKQVRVQIIEKTCKAIDIELSSVFFGKALDIRMDARPQTVGTFAAQIRHFESVRSFMTGSTLFVLADTPLALVFIFVILLIAGPVALVPFLILPLAVAAGMFFRKPIEDATYEHMKESNYKNGLLIEAIDGIESIKAANAEWKLRHKWRKLTERIAISDVKVKVHSMTSMHLTMFIQQMSYVGIIAVGVYQIAQGDLSMGGLIACTIISGRALTPMAQIPNLIVQWKQAQIAIKALDGIMELPSERDPGARLIVPEVCQGKLLLENVTFRYKKDSNDAIDVARLAIQPGERVGIIGPVGSGKTTALKVLSGLYRASTGAFLFDDIDSTSLAPEFVREHIGYLPQDVRLFNGTLRDNLVLGLSSPSDSEILRVANLTGLSEAIANHPKGLELIISEGGRGLSGGQRQLVGVTRMLLAKPKVILLDEPTASMDARLETRIMDHFFQELPSSSTLVVVTHKTSVLKHVQRVVVMNLGKVVLDGPTEQVMAQVKGEAPPPPATPPAVPSADQGGAA